MPISRESTCNRESTCIVVFAPSTNLDRSRIDRGQAPRRTCGCIVIARFVSGMEVPAGSSARASASGAEPGFSNHNSALLATCLVAVRRDPPAKPTKRGAARGYAPLADAKAQRHLLDSGQAACTQTACRECGSDSAPADLKGLKRWAGSARAGCEITPERTVGASSCRLRSPTHASAPVTHP